MEGEGCPFDMHGYVWICNTDGDFFQMLCDLIVNYVMDCRRAKDERHA